MIGDTTKCRIAQFGCRMLSELIANQEKGDWEHWTPQDTELIEEMKHHLAKLDAAIFTRNAAAIAEHSADLANFAMKAWELYAS